MLFLKQVKGEEHTLHSRTERKPMPPIAPMVPVFRTQASQPSAKTCTQPLVTSAWTRTNMEKAKGTSAKGRCTMTAVAVGNVSCDHRKRSFASETSVARCSFWWCWDS